MIFSFPIEAVCLLGAARLVRCEREDELSDGVAQLILTLIGEKVPQAGWQGI